MNIETLLEDALEARTSDVRPDPAARERIAEQLLQRVAPSRAPGRRSVVLATAAAVVTVAGIGVGSGLLASSGHDTGASSSRGPASTGGDLPGYPLPPSKYFVAVKGQDASAAGSRDVVVRAADGKIVATLPDIGSRAAAEPQLSPDGTRAYAVWGNGTRIGYLDLETGAHHALVHRTGEVDSPVLSADGSTLAYQWTPRLDGNDVSSIVVRNLGTGHERVLAHAPAGPQAIPLALSPDGSQLALVPTDRSPRPLWLMSTTAPDARTHVQVDTVIDCGGTAGSTSGAPRWTTWGLYLSRHCLLGNARATSDIMTVDLAQHRATLLHRVPRPATFFFTVLAGPSEPLFVTSDETDADHPTVTVLDPARAWMATPIKGLAGLAVSGSE